MCEGKTGRGMRQLVAGKHLAKFVSFVPKFPHFSHEDGSGGDVDDDNEGRRREGPPPLSLSVASGDRMHSEKGLEQAGVYSWDLLASQGKFYGSGIPQELRV